MNRECIGDFFIAEGKRRYRCLLDGSVIFVHEIKNYCCSNCNRKIAFPRNLGELKVHSVTKKYVIFPHELEVEIEEIHHE